MATCQLTASTISSKNFPIFQGLRLSAVKVSPPRQQSLAFRSFVIRAATTAAPKYTKLVKIKTADEKTVGGILLPTSAQTKPQGGEVVAVGEGRTIGKNKVEIDVKTGSQVVYSK